MTFLVRSPRLVCSTHRHRVDSEECHSMAHPANVRQLIQCSWSVPGSLIERNLTFWNIHKWGKVLDISNWISSTLDSLSAPFLFSSDAFVSADFSLSWALQKDTERLNRQTAHRVRLTLLPRQADLVQLISDVQFVAYSQFPDFTPNAGRNASPPQLPCFPRVLHQLPFRKDLAVPHAGRVRQLFLQLQLLLQLLFPQFRFLHF